MIKKLIVFMVGFISIANADQIVVNVPVEQKIVELHMMRKTDDKQDEARKKRGKAELVPLTSYGLCSGSFITGTGDILTAKHCVDGFDEIEIVTFDGQHYNMTAKAVSSSHDIAILHIDRINTPHFTLAATLTRGETVYALGSPLGITNSLSTGIVAKLDGDTTLIDCSVLPGNSGSPLFNKDGELVGVVTAGYIVGLGTTHLNIAQSLNVVKFFLAAIFGR